jgi:hypothetical protein
MAKEFYVSMIREGRVQRVALLAGPFPEHDAALAMVEPARKLAYEADPRSHWDLFGTVGRESDGRKGVLNARLGLA